MVHGVNFTNILRAAFLCKRFLCSFYVLTFWVCNFLAKEFGHKSCSLNVGEIDTSGQCNNTFFPSSLMMRPNKLEGLSLETLSSQVLEFKGKARANPIGASFRCFLLE
jgi:hypothetical protein